MFGQTLPKSKPYGNVLPRTSEVTLSRGATLAHIARTLSHGQYPHERLRDIGLPHPVGRRQEEPTTTAVNPCTGDRGPGARWWPHRRQPGAPSAAPTGREMPPWRGRSLTTPERVAEIGDRLRAGRPGEQFGIGQRFGHLGEREEPAPGPVRARSAPAWSRGPVRGGSDAQEYPAAAERWHLVPRCVGLISHPRTSARALLPEVHACVR